MSSATSTLVVEEAGTTALQRLGLLVFTAIFLTGGWQQLNEPAPRAQQARRLGLPVPDDLVKFSGAAMVTSALALQVTPLRRFAAAVLALLLPPITFVGHRFWEMEPGPQRNGQRVNFMKNLSLIGAAIFIAATPTHYWTKEREGGSK